MKRSRPRAIGLPPAGLVPVVGLAAGSALLLAACATATPGNHPSSGVAASTTHAVVSAPSSAAPSTPPATSPVTSSAAAPAASSGPTPAAIRLADAQLGRLTSYLGAGGVSIMAVDTADGATFRYGSTKGMLCASIAKLYILETLLLVHQDAGTALGEENTELATEMIENSDNDAANDLYSEIGEGQALQHAAAALHVEHTTPGPGIYWGFTRTNAADFVALLDNLVSSGPLHAPARRFALQLLSHVESDQRWGIGSVADRGTTFYNKNGWLAASPDANRWAVNSVGIVTVHGQRLLMAVLTQHGSDFDSGVELVNELAHVTATAVTTR